MLNDAFISIALAFGFTNPILASYRASQTLIQAMPPGSSPLLQLPNMTRTSAKQIEDAALLSQRRHLNVQDLMDLPEVQRKELFSNAGLAASQYETAVAVASQLPRLVVERTCLLYTSPSPRDGLLSRMPSSA